MGGFDGNENQDESKGMLKDQRRTSRGMRPRVSVPEKSEASACKVLKKQKADQRKRDEGVTPSVSLGTDCRSNEEMREK